MIPEVIGYLLHQCSKTRTLTSGMALHDVVLKTGFISDTIVSNHIVNMYAKCQSLASARKVFDEMSERNLVSWSTMISGYDQAQQPSLAIAMFSLMRKEGYVPNEFVFGSVISACASLGSVVEGCQVHALSVKVGCDFVSFVLNSLVSMYMKCGKSCDAVLVHEESCEPNVVSYNAVITGFVENQQKDRGFEMFKIMLRQGLVPDRLTFGGLLGICENLSDFYKGAALHCLTVKLKLDSCALVGDVLMTMYSKFNMLDEAEKVFKFIEEKDLFSWNSFVTACSHCGEYVKALRVFKEMLNHSDRAPDEFTFASALAACAGLACIRHGKQIHAYSMRNRLCENVGVGNALVNMYAKCGSIEHAYNAFKKMPLHNLVSWNTVIGGFGNHGLGGKALEVYEQVKATGLKPDTFTLVGVLTACNHAGLVEEGIFHFNSMEDSYGIRPSIEHLSCLIDLLGRAGRLHEAEEYMKKVSFGSDPIILGSMLSACRLHGDANIGERLAKQLLELQPVTTAPYVLLSNMYALDEMWNAVAGTRRMLKFSGLKKEPGHSLIEVKGIFEKFTARNFSHSRIEEIKDMLNVLTWAVADVSCNQ